MKVVEEEIKRKTIKSARPAYVYVRTVKNSVASTVLHSPFCALLSEYMEWYSAITNATNQPNCCLSQNNKNLDIHSNYEFHSVTFL